MKFDKFDFKSILNDNEWIRLYSNTFQSFKCIGYYSKFHKKSKNWVTLKKYAKFEKIENFEKWLNLLKMLKYHSEGEIESFRGV